MNSNNPLPERAIIVIARKLVPGIYYIFKNRDTADR
jgi:hypothetical protein